MMFTVVGVLDKQKQAFGGGKNPQDNQAYFPDYDVPQDSSGASWTTGSALKYRRPEEQGAGGGRADGAAAASAQGGK